MAITNQRMTIESIKPERAANLLAGQEGNRKPNKTRIQSYARMIRHGLWELNGVPIQLAHLPDGRCLLLDGQNRLNAILVANMPALMTIIERDCIEDDARRLFATFDVGKVRTIADLVHVSTDLGFEGVAESHIVAAISALGVLDILEAEGAEVYSMFSAAERRELLEDGLHDVLWAASVRLFYRGSGRTGVPTGVLAAAIAAHRLSPEAAMQFYHSVFAGEGLYDGEPGYLLNKDLVRNDPDTKGTAAVHHWWYCLTVKAWNLHTKGVKGRTMLRNGLRVMGWNPAVLPMSASDDRAAD